MFILFKWLASWCTFGINRKAYTKTQQCLDVNPRTVDRIQKEFDESFGEYEGTIAWKTQFVWSDKKSTLKFIGETHTVNDTYHSN